MSGKFDALLDSMSDQGQSHRGTAFIIESLLLLIFVTASIAIVVQLLGFGYSQGMQADKLSNAVYIASNEAERFTADPDIKSRQIVYLQTQNGLERIATEKFSNEKPIEYEGKKISLDDSGVYVLKRKITKENFSSGKLYNASIVVDCQGNEVYSLDVAKYMPNPRDEEFGIIDDGVEGGV